MALLQFRNSLLILMVLVAVTHVTRGQSPLVLGATRKYVEQTVVPDFPLTPRTYPMPTRGGPYPPGIVHQWYADRTDTRKVCILYLRDTCVAAFTEGTLADFERARRELGSGLTLVGNNLWQSRKGNFWLRLEVDTVRGVSYTNGYLISVFPEPKK